MEGMTIMKLDASPLSFITSVGSFKTGGMLSIFQSVDRQTNKNTPDFIV